MKKTVQVIIKDQGSKIGKFNSIQSVSLGYAINYLLPNNLAEIATKGRIKHVRMLQTIQLQRAKITYQSNLKIKNNLDKVQKISIRKKLGPNQQIFGRITENDILKEVAKLTGEKIDKKQIKIPNIKEIGTYDIKVKIEENLNSNIKLYILPSIL